MLCVKVIAARIQRNLCDPRISVVFDPARSAGLVIGTLRYEDGTTNDGYRK